MIIITSIIIFAGCLGGFANYHRYEINQQHKLFNLRRSLLSGLVASATVPLFLQMVSSNLLAEAHEPGGEYKYFIFGGFCLIAAFFSNRFLQSVSDKVIQDLQQKTTRIEREALENREKVDVLIDDKTLQTDLRSNLAAVSIDIEPMLIQGKATDEFLELFSSDTYRFRTLGGMSKELGIEEDIAADILRELESKELVKGFTNTEGNRIFSITKKGRKLVCII